MEIKEIGNLKEGQQSWKSPQTGRVYDVTGISPTLNTCGGGGHEVKIVEKKVMGGIYTDVTENFNRGLYPNVSRTVKAVKNDAGCIERQIVASRGRNPENPSDRTAGVTTEQVLEPNFDNICNALTTVQKDSMILEKRVSPNRTHNMSKTRLYNIWTLMKRRCDNPNVESYKDYGGRGIGYCTEWEKFEPFRDWALSNGYSDELSIDRIDNDKGYSPENCRWATKTEQVNNRRNWGVVPYYGIVKDNTGYRAQVTVNGKKIYIAHSVNDIEYLVRKRNEYIDKHNLPCKKNIIYDFDTHAETVKIKQATKDGYVECRIGGVADLSYPESETRRGRVIDGGNVSPTLIASQNEIYRIVTQYRVRKLTPKECWRLMGFSDEDYEKAAEVNSKTQLYKQSGNSIVKDVLMAIFSQLNIKGVPMWNEVHHGTK